MADAMQAPEPDDVQGAALNAMYFLATGIAAAGNPSEQKDMAAAFKSLADGWVLMNPALIAPQGVSPDVIKASVPDRPATRDGDRDGQIGE